MRRDYNLSGKQEGHIIRCGGCGRNWHDSLVRECPLEPGRMSCMYCCGECAQSYRDGSGWGCRQFSRRRKKDGGSGVPRRPAASSQ